MHKVSRERVGTEMDGMLRGARPTAAVALLMDTGLLPLLLTTPRKVCASGCPLLPMPPPPSDAAAEGMLTTHTSDARV